MCGLDPTKLVSLNIMLSLRNPLFYLHLLNSEFMNCRPQVISGLNMCLGGGDLHILNILKIRSQYFKAQGNSYYKAC